ncbi:MAG: UDP-N-acetylmuramate dehydrogenase [Actinomyces urogenitalis]|uniref:UDP-N-acetylenolpyruvoylglucosamine reductase n=2 Tax=Actinomyces urogenitalis TaxID=103621 RepID=A0A2I1KSN2_9ACTO|nr:UDP-N-acetylmuramate dehydrogenase [Actinomyces urogenitalis]MBS5977235.1 UDP-N-acetylmuramate dehydrogenase [Actinomyces urogenitalis]MDK8238183.1 UDP-N-acetylmuramate dehydrogenase [Actinomyces urogenitalis]MDK8835109.1 UDP-N-acetylmuramate dehydrogenase [Actinomyces urogenitalis]MDU0972137.1 UDP-N-acetylmuramate dehydrogenase [Actinomyces urogenitalis]MDU5427114.1 UDP-N-acetylmuramate dehydrogenase [Actinomyces urogenitalis]
MSQHSVSGNLIGDSINATEQCMMPISVDASPDQWPAGVPALAHVPGSAPAPTTLAELTTMAVGGPVGEYVEATSESELIDAVRQADEAGRPLLVVGGGSNILAADAGFDGLVLRDARQEVSLLADDRCGGVEISATAGTTWDDLVRQAVACEWGGFETLSGIPGTVGAAPVQNIGAYGTEVAELLASVRVWDRSAGQAVQLPLSRLQLSYRDSALKRSLTDPQVGEGWTWGPTGRWVVLSATFSVRQASLSAPIAYSQLAQALGVSLGERVDSRAVREAVLELRRSKGMVLDPDDHDTWSAGSFFTNPVLTAQQAERLPPEAPRYPVTDHTKVVPGTVAAPVVDGLVKTSAAWLIEHAGFPKGFSLASGDAGQAPASLSTKHVLALTNRGKARASDIAALRDAVVAGVQQAYGITLVPEPVHVGW